VSDAQNGIISGDQAVIAERRFPGNEAVQRN
jgi:hypothetical protein